MKRQKIDVAARQAVITEYGEIDRQMKLWRPPVNPHTARHAELSAIILSWGLGIPGAQPYALDSSSYRLDMKPAQLQRDMGPEAQEQFFDLFSEYQIVGENGKACKFNPFEVFHVSQADVITHLGKPTLDRIAPQERTGPRKFEVLPKGAPAIQKAA